MREFNDRICNISYTGCFYSDDNDDFEEGEAKWWKWSEGTVQLGRGNDNGSDDLDAIKTGMN